MKARKLILEIKEEYEQIRLRKKVIKRHSGTRCSECEAEVSWMTIPEASATLRIAEKEILILLATTGLHFKIEREGEVLICGMAVEAFKNEP